MTTAETSSPSWAARMRSRLRPILVVGVMLFIMAEIIALSPSSLEENKASTPGVSFESLMASAPSEETLATDIPKDTIPDYTVEGFHYVSTKALQKQWKIEAKKANLFNKSKLVHARTVTAYLYNPDGTTTVITGKEAKYFTEQKDLEVFGDAVAKFPDGFETHSEYLRYFPNQRKIYVPTKYPVHGGGKEKDGQEMLFQSLGLSFEMEKSEITLPEAVRVTVIRPAPKPAPAPSVSSEDFDGFSPRPSPKPVSTEPEKTTIDSDHCLIYRNQQLAHFTMDPSRPLEKRFVEINQPTLYVRSRRADLNYGSGGKQQINYMTAFEDVLIRELPDPSLPKNSPDAQNLRYGTGGRADFDSRQDIIKLTEYPQVYQNNDTVIGDVILLHRSSDVVEVEHSNAFSEGNQQAPEPSPSPSSHPQSR